MTPPFVTLDVFDEVQHIPSDLALLQLNHAVGTISATQIQLSNHCSVILANTNSSQKYTLPDGAVTRSTSFQLPSTLPKTYFSIAFDKRTDFHDVRFNTDHEQEYTWTVLELINVLSPSPKVANPPRFPMAYDEAIVTIQSVFGSPEETNSFSMYKSSRQMERQVDEKSSR